MKNPPERGKYANLKEAILQRLSDSRQKKIHTVLNDLVLRDRKPSQLLREMRDLAEDTMNDEVIRKMWLDRLSSNLRPFLAASDHLDLTALVKTADKMLEYSPHDMAVAATHHTASSMENPTEKKLDAIQHLLNTLVAETRQLQAIVAQHEIRLQAYSQPSLQQEHRSRPRDRSNSSRKKMDGATTTTDLDQPHAAVLYYAVSIHLFNQITQARQTLVQLRQKTKPAVSSRSHGG